MILACYQTSWVDCLYKHSNCPSDLLIGERSGFMVFLSHLKWNNYKLTNLDFELWLFHFLDFLQLHHLYLLTLLTNTNKFFINLDCVCCLCHLRSKMRRPIVIIFFMKTCKTSICDIGYIRLPLEAPDFVVLEVHILNMFSCLNLFFIKQHWIFLLKSILFVVSVVIILEPLLFFVILI